jgi:cell division protein FtsQ
MALCRRFALPAAVTALVLWLVTWAVVSGLPGRMAHTVQHRYYVVTAHAGFAVRDILVEGRINTDPDVLLSLIGMKRGDPIFAFHPGPVKAELERVPWIKAAKVERRLPDTIYVALTERLPAALWQSKGKLKLIDAEGVVLADTGLAKFRRLLLVVGENAPAHVGELEALLQGQPDVQDRVEAAVYVSGRRWDLRLKNGLTVRLPESDPGLALARLARAQHDDKLLDKDLTSVDLRDGDRIIVATKPGAVQEYKASASGDNI